MTTGKHRASARRKHGLIVAGTAAAAYVAGTIAARRLGYSFGLNVIVKCRSGHVFSTIWIPGGSLKSLRLGFWRVQWCPVGGHVTLVHPLRDAEVTDEVRRAAAGRHDPRIP
jgi:hypothetical protein